MEKPENAQNALIAADFFENMGKRAAPLPTEVEFEEKMKEKTVYILDNPSKNYTIQKKIGVGGFGKVYLCKRISDNGECALKFVDPKDQKEKNIIKNEIALMQIAAH